MEPWYETQEITKSEVRLIILDTWFHRELHNTNKPPTTERKGLHPNQMLRKTLSPSTWLKQPTETSPPYRHVTFEAIRCHPDWTKCAERALLAEIDKVESFGSHRGFFTFCREPLVRAYAKEVVKECWAKPILARFAQRWLEHHYAFGGGGYHQAKTSFDEALTTYRKC